jgi:hypothetical protein
MEKLPSRLIDALIGVCAKKIAQGLNEIRWKMARTISIKK